MRVMRKRVIVGITGASGIPVAVEVLRMLRERPEYESHLVVSESGRLTISYESDCGVEAVEHLADYVYDTRDIGAPVASGTFRSEGMIIVPCSMKTAAGIASGYSDSLLLRAADVMLKERRRLVLAVRECPLSLIHLRNLSILAEAGADILPLVMTFYNHPEGTGDMAHHIACKVLERIGVEAEGFRRWKDGEGGRKDAHDD